MFKAGQGASPPPTHVRAKETALRGQERRFSFFPLFGFSSEWFTARNHGGLNINLFSLRITDCQEILHYRQMSQFKLPGYLLYTQKNEVGNTDNVCDNVSLSFM